MSWKARCGRSTSKARITAHLFDAASAACLWSEQRDLAHDQILGFDRSLALHLTAIFRREDRGHRGPQGRRRRRARARYLGWYHLGLRELYRFSMPGLRNAHQHFERAIALDPEFAAALARLAYVFQQMYWYGPREERAQNLEKGLAAARQAVGLDPKSAHGHFALGRLCSIRGDFDLAIRELETAIGLDGGFAQAYFGLGQAMRRPATRLRPSCRSTAPSGSIPTTPIPGRSTTIAPRPCFALGRLAEAERFSRIAVGLPNASHFRARHAGGDHGRGAQERRHGGGRRAASADEAGLDALGGRPKNSAITPIIPSWASIWPAWRGRGWRPEDRHDRGLRPAGSFAVFLTTPLTGA